MKYQIHVLIVCACFAVIYAGPIQKRDIQDVKQYLKSLTRDPNADVFQYLSQKKEREQYSSTAHEIKGCSCEAKKQLRKVNSRKKLLMRLMGGIGIIYALRAFFQSVPYPPMGKK
uniref:Uncharacterized protein n=1 Tax=Clastoptera arizonana TaxID=38151 RepID=A0A1B6DGB1_9HEMI